MATHTESPGGYLDSEEQGFYHITGEMLTGSLDSILESGTSTAFTQSKREKIRAKDRKTYVIHTCVWNLATHPRL